MSTLCQAARFALEQRFSDDSWGKTRLLLPICRPLWTGRGSCFVGPPHRVPCETPPVQTEPVVRPRAGRLGRRAVTISKCLFSAAGLVSAIPAVCGQPRYPAWTWRNSALRTLAHSCDHKDWCDGYCSRCRWPSSGQSQGPALMERLFRPRERVKREKELYGALCDDPC